MQGTGVSCELMFITRLCPTLCDLMGCSTPGIPVPYCLLEFAQVYIHCISDAIQPSHSLMPSSPLPSISIGPSSEYSGLSSLKICWFDLLPGQGTFKSLLQHHSLKASMLWCSACFTVQLSQLYMTTGKTIALTIWTFVGRVMSLLFNTLSRFVIAFLPRSSCLLSWLQSPSAVIL